MTGGMQSFVAWRYLMERRAPMHWFILYTLLGVQVFAALGLGFAEGLVLGNLEWRAVGAGVIGHLAVDQPVYASAGLGFFAAMWFAIPATWRHGVPWRGMLGALAIGLLLGALVPLSWRAFGMPGPKLVAVLAAFLPVAVLILLACLGSRPLGALVLAFLIAGIVLYAVGWELEHYWRAHHPGRPPYNKLVKSMSNLHEYDGVAVRALVGIGIVFLVGGILLVTIARGRRLAHWRSVVGWGVLFAGIILAAMGGAFTMMVVEQTAAEQARWIGLLCMGPLALLVPLGVFRFFFTFFTTVSMSGVFVGAMALVVVLSVMSGFESDLQTKILGSNAHIRITRTEGMMSDWREVMEKVKGIRGVRGVTPYATTEVVLSANSNYATVVIKGIDVDTVADVTELFKDIESQAKTEEARKAERLEAVRRLFPLEKDPLDSAVQVDDSGGGSDDTAPDQAPPDLVDDGGDPIDFSGDEGPIDPAPDDFTAAPDDEEPAPIEFGGEEDVEPNETDEPDAIDDPGSNSIELKDLIDADDPSAPDFLEEPEGGRLALLDGVLVGRELVHQLHLFGGQEVRLVSPLADPANPDATGTPIPFHRDYRIAGIFYTGMYEYDLKFVYVPLESLQDFIQIGDDVDGIEVRVDDPEYTEAVREAIQKELGPDYAVKDWKELNRNLFTALKLEKIAMFLVLAIIILVASFSIVGNLIMVVVEKGKEIALLKTLGASDVGVMAVFITQGFFIGLVGTLTGVIEGVLICLGCKIFGFPINADVYYISTLPIDIELLSVGAIAAAGLMISAVATLYPAFMAARLRPAEGLRHD